MSLSPIFHHVAHEVEIYRIADSRQCDALRFKQFQASARIRKEDSKYGEYKEAWHLLRRKAQLDCAD